jgi:hypothetical protein
MTTKVKITCCASSNGDVHVRSFNPWQHPMRNRLAPGESTEVGITDSSIVHVFETMPASKESTAELVAGERADELIATEVAGQDVMWGAANERADSSQGQLLAAGLAQLEALRVRRDGREDAFDYVPPVYPHDWSGFRDYGSDVANLVVAAAFLRQEIKRLIASGADTTRLRRDQVKQPYKADQPAQAFPADPTAPVADAPAAPAPVNEAPAEKPAEPQA